LSVFVGYCDSKQKLGCKQAHFALSLYPLQCKLVSSCGAKKTKIRFAQHPLWLGKDFMIAFTLLVFASWMICWQWLILLCCVKGSLLQNANIALPGSSTLTVPGSPATAPAQNIYMVTIPLLRQQQLLTAITTEFLICCLNFQVHV